MRVSSEMVLSLIHILQLYLFNRERFEKIGASDLYSALSDMKAYKFPSQYTPEMCIRDRVSTGRNQSGKLPLPDVVPGKTVSV